MAVSATPHTRFATALIAAGVVSAATLPTAMPEHPTISVNVANTSAVTDALSAFGKSVEVASSLVGIHVDATFSLPFEATLAVLAAQQHPESSANVLSYLVQRFVNPAVGAPIYAYPWETEQTAALVASLFPYPLGPSATDIGLINQARFAFADVFNGVLGQLPDPLPGYHAVQAVMNDSTLGGAVVAGQLAVRAPVYMAWNTVNYLGNLPVNVEASLESAIQTPDQIPGLVSNLIYGLLSPNASVGLFGQLLNNVVDPLTWLPAPIGYDSAAAIGLANQVRAVIADVMNRVLSLLPTPVTPSALPVATAASGQPIYGVNAGKGAVAAPVPAPAMSLAIVDDVAVAPAKTAEKPSSTIVSKVDVPKVPVADGAVVAVADEPVAKDASAATVGESEPMKVEPTKVDQDKIDNDAVEPTKVEPKTIEQDDQATPKKTEPAKVDPKKSEPKKAEPAAAEKGGVSSGSRDADSDRPSRSAGAAA